MYTEAFLGEIKLFGFDFAPTGFAQCSGQLLEIRNNTALFSLIGTRYGGDGMRTFALPNLNGRAVTGAGKDERGEQLEVGQQRVAEGKDQSLSAIVLNYCICVDGIFPSRPY